MVILLSRLGPFITKVYQGQHRQHLPTKWDDPPSNMTGYSPAAKPKKGSVAHHSSFRGKYWALATIQEITDDLLRIDLAYFIFPEPKKNWNHMPPFWIGYSSISAGSNQSFLWQDHSPNEPWQPVGKSLKMKSQLRDCANSSINMYQSIHSIVPWMDISWMD